MDVKYINPFVEAVQSVFTTMMQMEVTLGAPYLAQVLPRHDASGIIGMSGDVVGAVVLSFPASVATKVIARFAGQECSVTSAEFADALGEIVNMISGAAKAKFHKKKVSISTPTVVIGPGHSVARPMRAVCISLPCKCEYGEFSIDIAMREENPKNTTHPQGAKRSGASQCAS